MEYSSKDIIAKFVEINDDLEAVKAVIAQKREDFEVSISDLIAKKAELHIALELLKEDICLKRQSSFLNK